MFCGNCGKPLNEGALFCPECGTPVKKIETENVNVEETTASQSQPNNIPIRNYDPRFDYTPLGTWSYFLYTLLFSIPIIGFIFAIVFAVGGTNRINLRNYARSYFCWLLITVVLVIMLLIVGFAIAEPCIIFLTIRDIITITCKKIQPESKKIKLTRGYLKMPPGVTCW